MARIPCPSEAWDCYARDRDADEDDDIEVITYCPTCRAQMDSKGVCADCYARELREAELALQLQLHTFPVSPCAGRSGRRGAGD